MGVAERGLYIRMPQDRLRHPDWLLLVKQGRADRQEALLGGIMQAKLPPPDPAESDDEDEDQENLFQLDDFERQIAKDLADLEDNVVEHSSGSRDVFLRIDWLRSLNAVVTDALARYEYDEDQLNSYMFSLMGVRD